MVKLNTVELAKGCDQIDDDYIRDIQEGLARILEEIMKGEKKHGSE